MRATAYRPKELLTLTDSGFLFDTSNGESYTLNATGIRIVQALLRGDDADAIARALAETFEVADEEARRDVEKFLQRLRGLGLVEAEERGDG